MLAIFTNFAKIAKILILVGDLSSLYFQLLRIWRLDGKFANFAQIKFGLRCTLSGFTFSTLSLCTHLYSNLRYRPSFISFYQSKTVNRTVKSSYFKNISRRTFVKFQIIHFLSISIAGTSGGCVKYILRRYDAEVRAVAFHSSGQGDDSRTRHH